MILVLIVVLIIVAVTSIAIILRRGTGSVHNLDELSQLSRPVDLQAFQNLIDPDEESYLRVRLRPGDFRKVQRARMLVALQYVRNTSHNAGLLLQFAQYARSSSDQDIVAAARALSDSAVQLRTYSLLAMLIFSTRVAFPSLPLRSSSIIASYGRMCDHMAGLTRMQVPTSIAELEAVL